MLDRTVAVTVLRSDLDPDNLARFLREQRVMGCFPDTRSSWAFSRSAMSTFVLTLSTFALTFSTWACRSPRISSYCDDTSRGRDRPGRDRPCLDLIGRCGRLLSRVGEAVSG